MVSLLLLHTLVLLSLEIFAPSYNNAPCISDLLLVFMFLVQVALSNLLNICVVTEKHYHSYRNTGLRFTIILK